jgi:NADH-quinone oxidoreductase subunit J
MTEAFFYLMAALVIGGGLGVVLARNTVYAALMLIVSLLGVAGVYVLLSVEFLALVQVLIYAGAVTVLLLFALMLTRVRDVTEEPAYGGQLPLAAVAGVAFIAVMAAVVTQTDWPGEIGTLTVVPLRDIGVSLFDRWAVPFELASGVLLVALAGAIILAMQEKEES